MNFAITKELSLKLETGNRGKNNGEHKKQELENPESLKPVTVKKDFVFRSRS